jgi:hypothetical protein
MPSNDNRDNFTEATRKRLERQARGHCSNPACRRLTSAAASDGQSEIRIGEAAHICAAAPGGRRYKEIMASNERRSADNGIWLCEVCARAIDSKDPTFTEELLHEWKRKTDEDSWKSIIDNVPYGPGMHVPTLDELGRRLHAAATADLDVFKRSDKWPQTDVALTLEVDTLGKSVDTASIGAALATIDDLVLIARPGTGKTSALFQIANAALTQETATPLIVPLADWSAGTLPILDSVLRRAAYQGISEADLRAVAGKPGVALILDGWNELDSAARRRARADISWLRAELPELTLLVSTRRQVLDVPFEGQPISVMVLSDAQQMGIARAMRGEQGARVVDEAWRSPGVRELVTIPLYLTALLQLPEGQPFPTTKEDVLRRFVAMHEENVQRAEIFAEVTHGCQAQFLDGLAVTATRAANTTISEMSARKSVADTDTILVTEGQITTAIQPTIVLNTLVSHHVLVRSAEPAGYSFQHQQFQEWYASNEVEHMMLKGASDSAALQGLKADILNNPEWEESILFAVERMSRGEVQQQDACAVAIVAAFDVDPILSADMIVRSTDAVWTKVADTIRKRVRRWHTPGKLDRSLRFMITSGRPEFADLVWPLITAENDQKSLPALRAARRFRPSVLGPDAATRIAGLPSKVRETVLHEIADRSGMDGLDLATAIAKADPDPEVKATVVDALSFRRADRHVVDLLRTADAATFDLIQRKGYLDDIEDQTVRAGLAAARGREEQHGVSDRNKLSKIVYAHGGDDRSAELTALVATMDIDRKEHSETGLIHEGRKRYESAVAQGLLERVRNRREMFYGAEDILAASGLTLEDGDLLEIALESSGRHDDRAEAAAAVLGPNGVGRMIDAMLEAMARIRAHGSYDEGLSDRYYALRERIAHAPGSSLVAAVQQRAACATNEDICVLAGPLSRRRDEDGERGRHFDAAAHAAIGELALQWGERLLQSGDSATRNQLVAVAEMIGHSPALSLLPMLKRLADDELRRYKAFREQAAAAHWRQCEATNEARTLHTNRYQQAFTAIKSPETTALMIEYLPDEHFGGTAALVLKVQWIEAHEPKDKGKRFFGGVDFSRVEEKRGLRATEPTATCAEGEYILAAINSLIAEDPTDAQKKHAVVLGIEAARLPHGERPDTLQTLITMAPQTARAKLVLNLVLSGETIPFDTVKAGVAAVLEAAKKQRWILTEGGWQLKAWLLLLPFTDQPARLVEIVQSLPDLQREPHFLEEMIGACGAVSSPDIETALFALAEDDARFYDNHAWGRAILRRSTLSAARRYLECAIDGKLTIRRHDSWHMSQEISGLLGAHAELRARVYALLREPSPKNFDILARAVAEDADTEGLLLLVELENKSKRSLISGRTIEGAVTEHVPSEHWKGAFNVLPVSAADLRSRLLALTTDGGVYDTAARVLTQIDKVRDDYGAAEGEPRHPNLASGRPWPIMAPDPDAEDGT